MKKFLIVTSALLIMPVYALCPLDPSGNGSCTQNIIPSTPSVSENNAGISVHSADLTPLRESSIDTMRSPNNRLNDTLSCPFGICAQGILNPYSNMP